MQGSRIDHAKKQWTVESSIEKSGTTKISSWGNQGSRIECIKYSSVLLLEGSWIGLLDGAARRCSFLRVRGLVLLDGAPAHRCCSTVLLLTDVAQ
jgi:hypothetical protein